MTVKQLRDKLSEFDDDLEVVIVFNSDGYGAFEGIIDDETELSVMKCPLKEIEFTETGMTTRYGVVKDRLHIFADGR
jgi:hypothetical protein